MFMCYLCFNNPKFSCPSLCFDGPKCFSTTLYLGCPKFTLAKVLLFVLMTCVLLLVLVVTICPSFKNQFKVVALMFNVFLLVA
jgi:hypothetical protein